jgi:hypothetical protein
MLDAAKLMLDVVGIGNFEKQFRAGRFLVIQ